MFDLFIHFRVAASHESSLSDIQIFGGKLSSLRLQMNSNQFEISNRFKISFQKTVHLRQIHGLDLPRISMPATARQKIKGTSIQIPKKRCFGKFCSYDKACQFAALQGELFTNLTIHLFIVRRLRNVSVSIKGSELCTRRGVKEFY